MAVEGADPLGVLCVQGHSGEGGQTLQGQGGVQRQQAAPGELLPLLLRQGEGSGQAPLSSGAVEGLQEGGHLLPGHLLLEGQQVVQIRPQQPGQGGQQGDLRQGGVPLPLAHCRGGDPQRLGHLLLGEPPGGPAAANDASNLHVHASLVVLPPGYHRGWGNAMAAWLPFGADFRTTWQVGAVKEHLFSASVGLCGTRCRHPPGCSEGKRCRRRGPALPTGPTPGKTPFGRWGLRRSRRR